MKRYAILIALIIILTQCHKNGSDWNGYGYLEGKWKLLYESDGFQNSPNRAFYTDNYEIEFTRHYRVRKIKNLNEEQKSKLTKCFLIISDPSVSNTCDFYFNTDANEQIRATMYTRDPNSDTLYVRGFYPVVYNPYDTNNIEFGIYVRE